MAAKKYTVLVGINIPPDDSRYEPGEEVYLDDETADILLSMGAVEHISVTQERAAEAKRIAAELAAAELAAAEATEPAEPTPGEGD